MSNLKAWQFIKGKRKRAQSSNPFFASTVKQVFHLYRKKGGWHWEIRASEKSIFSEDENMMIDSKQESEIIEEAKKLPEEEISNGKLEQVFSMLLDYNMEIEQ